MSLEETASKLHAKERELRDQIVQWAIAEGLIKTPHQLSLTLKITIRSLSKVPPGTNELEPGDWDKIFAIPWDDREREILEIFRTHNDAPVAFFEIQPRHRHLPEKGAWRQRALRDTRPVPSCEWSDQHNINRFFQKNGLPFFLGAARDADGKTLNGNGKKPSHLRQPLKFQIWKRI